MATALSSFSVTRTSWKTANQYNCQHLRNLKNAHNIVHARITSVHTEWDTRPKTPGKTTDSSSQTGKSSSGKPRLWSSGTIRLNGQPNTPLHLMTHSSHLMTSPTHPSDDPPLHLMTHPSIWWPAQHTAPSDDQIDSPTHPSSWWPAQTHPSSWWPAQHTPPSEYPSLHLMTRWTAQHTHLTTHPSIWWPTPPSDDQMTSPTPPSI